MYLYISYNHTFYNYCVQVLLGLQQNDDKQAFCPDGQLKHGLLAESPVNMVCRKTPVCKPYCASHCQIIGGYTFTETAEASLIIS